MSGAVLHLIHLQTMPAASASPVVRTARSMLMLYTVSRGLFVLQSLISYSSSFFLFLFFRFIFSLNRLACIYYYVVFDQPHRLKAVFYLMINLPHGAPMFHYPFLSVLFFFFIIIIILGAQPVPSVGNLLSARLQRRLFPTMKRSSSVCLYPGSFSLCSPSFFLFFRKIRKEMKSTKRRRAKSTSYIREESGGIVEQ